MNLPVITSIVLERTGQTLSVGQVWIDKNGSNAFKIIEIVRGQYTKIRYLKWDGENWLVPIWQYSNGVEYEDTKSLSDFESYYTLFDGDFEKIFAFGKAVISGKEPMPVPAIGNDDEIESTALMGMASKEYFLAMQGNLETQKKSVELVQMAMKVEIARKMQALEAIKSQMYGIVEAMNKKVAKVKRVIDTLELYMGVYEDIVQIQEGQSAGIDEPISFRQMALYMDEEIALYKFDADFTDIEVFDNWIVQNNNYKNFAPEEKCVVAFRPRRYDKHYGNDPLYNFLMNQENQKTYLLIRNGENIYRIWANIKVGKSLFPTRSELGKIGEKIASHWKSDQDRAEEEMHVYQRLAFVLQGLIDRTEVFQPIPKGIKIFELDKWESHVRFIYDMEATLPSGRLSFNDWRDSLRASICEGSRVVAVGLESTDYDKRFYRYYQSKYTEPSHPPSGLYQVHLFKETLGKYQKEHSSLHNSLCIRYNPGGEVRNGWSDWEGHERKNCVSFMIKPLSDNLLNYDMVSLDDIEFYLYNRTDRRNYAGMLPILLKVKEMILADLKWEADFVELASREFGGKHKEVIWDCIKWWKDEKVKWKRAITKDDTKALRMIKAEVKRRI